MDSSPNIKFSPVIKVVFLVVCIANCAVGIRRTAQSFTQKEIYGKDFISPYLMAKAAIDGVDPYLPLPDLAAIWMGYANYRSLKHPTPHPPGMGLLSLPLSFLSYESAAVVWLMFELVCLFISLLLLIRWWGTPVKTGTIAFLFGLTLGWVPVMQTLWFGQLNSCLLLLLLGAWLALRAGKDTLGGALLGGIIALKLMAWPIVIFLALRHKWKSVITAVTVTFSANLLAVATFGVDAISAYYLKVGPLIASLYRTHDANYSAWTWGWRLFGGHGRNYLAAPLWQSMPLARLLTYLVPLLVLAFGLWLATRVRSFDTAFGLLVGVAILISPIFWTHYLMLASIPMVIIARRLWTMGLPVRMTSLALGLLIPTLLGPLSYSIAARSFANQTTQDGIPIIPFAAGLITLIPAAALIGFLWVLWRLDYIVAPQDDRQVEATHTGFAYVSG